MPIHEPNYTQIPNIILDSLFLLSGAETKTALFICRQTFGYHRQSAKMSISFICTGTGLARQSVFTAIESLHLRGWIEKTSSGDSFEYALKIHAIEEVVQKLDQSKNLTSLKNRTEGSKNCTPTGLKIRTEVVQKLDTNKERKEKNKERSKESGALVPIAPVPVQDFQKPEDEKPKAKKGGRKKNEPRSPRSAPAVSKRYPDESVELWGRWSPMYKAFYGELDDRVKFMEGFDFLIDGGVELERIQTGTIAYVNGKNTAIAQGRKNSAAHPPRGDRFFAGKDGGESYCLRAYEALKEQESAKPSECTPVPSLPEWLTSPDDRFISWLCSTHLPQLPGYPNKDIAVSTAKDWLEIARQRPEYFERAAIAWEAFSGSKTPDNDRSKNWYEKPVWAEAWQEFSDEATKLGVKIRPQPGVGAYFYYALPGSNHEDRLGFSTNDRTCRVLLDSWKKRCSPEAATA